MKIITCPKCLAQYKADKFTQRQKIKCSKCQQIFEAVIETANEEKTDPFVGRNIGDYQILERLGEGGMGVVYRAKHLALNKLVAIKILPESYSRNNEYIQRFIREARLVAQFNHENIIQVFDVGKEGNTYYFVMELVEGNTVDNLLEEKRFDLIESIHIVKGVLQGLIYAGQKNIIHRDLKPDNIMITNDGRVKIMDFGLAKNITSIVQTQTGTVMGTVHYTSPEQCNGKSADIRSDIYSLGITFYELITGSVPFNGETPTAIMFKHVNEKLRFPPGCNIPISIQKIIKRMAEKDPKKRYQTPNDVLKDLNLLKDIEVDSIVIKSNPSVSRYVLLGASVLIILGGIIMFISSRKPQRSEAPKGTVSTHKPPPDTPITSPPPAKLPLSAPVTTIDDTPAKKPVIPIIPNSIEELWETPEEEINIARATLIIAQQVSPGINIELYLEQIKEMANKISVKLTGAESPKDIVKVINNYIYSEEKYEVMSSTGVRDEAFLNKVLDSKKGCCTGLSVLYLSIAERLKLPIYPVAAPSHLFVRYDDGENKFNIETTAEGKITGDDYYENDPRVTVDTVKNGIFFSNLTKRQFIGYHLVEAGIMLGMQNKFVRSLEIMNWAVKFCPKNPSAYFNRGVSYAKKKEFDRAITDLSEAIRLDNNYWQSYLARSGAYSDTYNFTKAVIDFSEVIRINPKNTMAYHLRGKIYVKEHREWAKAVEDFTIELKLGTNSAFTYFMRGYAYEELGKTKEAMQDFNKAEEIDPGTYKSARENRHKILKGIN